MRWIVVALGVLVAACAEEEPSPPPPALVVLQSSCEKGDTQSCAQVLAYEQRRQAMRQQAAADFAANYKPYYLPAPSAPTRILATPTQTRCTSNFGVMNCTSY